MIIYLKNKHTLEVDDFKFRCSIGKNGKSKKKKEGDKKTPIGYFEIEDLYYRSDRIKKPSTKLKCIKIKKNMGWCDNPFDLKNYNKLIKLNKKIKCEKLYRKDRKYDILIELDYNRKKIISNKGSAIFLHLTNNYKPTKGCVALSLNDIEILLKIIKKNSKIKLS